MKHTQIGSGAKCLLDIYHWEAGLAVTGRTRDIGQNILVSSLQTRKQWQTQLLPNFFLYRVLRRDPFIRNIIIIQCINYIIIIFINDKNGGTR